jgi:hypothetical protein
MTTSEAGPRAGADQREARKVVVSGKSDGKTSKLSHSQAQDTLRAELTGETCSSLGEVVGRGKTPVLALCRELLRQGISPDRALEVYRNGIMALRIRSIAKGAAFTVAEGDRGTPRFRRWKPMPLREGSPPARQIEKSDQDAGRTAEAVP